MTRFLKKKKKKKKIFPNNCKISTTDKINLTNVAPADTNSQTDSLETSHFPHTKSQQ